MPGLFSALAENSAASHARVRTARRSGLSGGADGAAWGAIDHRGRRLRAGACTARVGDRSSVVIAAGRSQFVKRIEAADAMKLG